MANEIGGAGGSGVVIVRYTSATQRWSGGQVTQVGGDWVHRFTRSGQLYSGSIVPDSSGNENFWTPNFVSTTSDATYDVMRDSPTRTSTTTANTCTLNPLAAGVDITSRDGNLRATASSSMNALISATVGLSTGAWYWEVLLQAGSSAWAGAIIRPTASLSAANLATGDAYAYVNTGQIITGQTLTNYGNSYTAGDRISVAFNSTSGNIWFAKNGVWQNNGNPATGANPAFSGISGTYIPAVLLNTASASVNFGQQPLTYLPPAGFLAINTFNLPSTTIPVGAEEMDATLYTGTGANLTITNARGILPDFVWIKSRNAAGSHYLFDSVRGSIRSLSTDTTAIDQNLGNSLTQFNANGFSLGSDASVNTAGRTYVAWQWQGSNAPSITNNSGSVVSMTSANPRAGFSVVTFINPASGTSTVGHGLNTAPQLIIAKARGAVSAWTVYSAVLGINQVLNFNTTSAATTQANIWGAAAPTGNVFGFNTTNQPASQNIIAYCFTSIPGYSAFGSYTGNGLADGPFIYTGFRPKFILIKASDRTPTNWDMTDTMRSSFNATAASLDANLPDMEYAGYTKDILSNGFKIRENNQDNNNSGSTYIYAAFAEYPFRTALAR